MSKRLAVLWPTAAVALPVLPSAVNLAQGRPLWIDGGSTSDVFFPVIIMNGLLPLWTIFNLVIGAGGMVALVLLAVALRRRRWVILVSTATLLLVAMIGILSVVPISRTAARLLDGLAYTPADISAGSQPDFSMGYLEGSLRVMPSSISWTGEGGGGISPLWFSAAFAGSAVLLILLSRAIHRRRPDAMSTPAEAPRRPPYLPVRWRASLMLWTAALVLTCLPYGFFLFASEIVEYDMISYSVGACPGFELHTDVSMYLSPLFQVPTPLVIAIGFGAWTLLARRGHLRWGLVAGWLAVIPVTLYGAITFVTAGLDAVIGQGCLTQWSEFLDPLTAVWQLYTLFIAVLVILAVRVRRGGPPRRGRTSRTVAALAVGVLLLTVTRMDTVPGKITSASSETCEPWETFGLPGKQPAPAEREIAFVCAARQEYASPERFAHMPDRELVALGRHLCGVTMRGDALEVEATRDRTGIYVQSSEMLQALTYLCPEVEQRGNRQAEQARVDNERFITTARRRCAELPGHRPLIRPAKQGRTMMWVEFGTLNVYEEEPGEDLPAIDDAFTNGLAGSAPGHLAILTADEVGHVCVTAEAYRKRPPVEIKGWDKVVEVGYRSTTGRLIFTDDRGISLPNLATNGIDGYRIRVHTRGTAAAMEENGDARQEFLIMAYPGSSKRTITLK